MRVLRIAFCATATGWLVGTLGFTTLFLPWQSDIKDFRDFCIKLVGVAFGTAVAVLPVGVVAVFPLTWFLLTKSFLWHPWLAAVLGGVAGIVSIGTYYVILVHRKGVWVEQGGYIMVSFGVIAFAVGAATGATGAWLARQPVSAAGNHARAHPHG